MPKFSEMNTGKYLKKEDFHQPALMTIADFRQENVALQGEPAELKWIIYFSESDRGMVLNPTNQQLLQIATGMDSTEASIGKKIVVYVDPTISMGGKIVGGLRIRAAKNQPKPAAPLLVEPVGNPEAEEDQSVPF